MVIRMKRYTALLFSCFLLFCGFPASALAAGAEQVIPASGLFHTVENAAIYASPDASGTPLAVVPAGFPVSITGVIGNQWFVAKMGDITCYLPAGSLVDTGAAQASSAAQGPVSVYAPLIAIPERNLSAGSAAEVVSIVEQAIEDRVISLNIAVPPAICDAAYHAAYDRLNALSASPVAGYNLADLRSMEVSYTTGGGGRVSVSFTYGSAGHDAEVESVVAAKAAEFAALPNNYEKIKAVHDYLCGSVDYVLDEYYSHTAYGALVTKWAVCDGYALAFQRFMDVLGIPCRIALGTRDGEPHAWNLVFLDGQWYHLDATWDDQRRGVIRDYFLISGAHAGYSSWGGITLAAADYPRR